MGQYQALPLLEVLTLPLYPLPSQPLPLPLLAHLQLFLRLARSCEAASQGFELEQPAELHSDRASMGRHSNPDALEA